MMAPLSYSTKNLERVSRFEPSAAPLQEPSLPATPVGDTHVAFTPHEPEQHPELVRFLSPVTFGAGLRVVWESVTQVPVGAGPIRTNGSAAVLTRVPPGTGLEAALDLAAARNCLHEQHWIVAVVSSNSLLAHLSQQVVERLQQVESRLAIVVLDDAKATGASVKAAASQAARGQYDRLSARWLDDLGLAHYGPVDGRNMASVQVQLRRIFQAQRPALLHLQARADGAGRSQPASQHHSKGRELVVREAAVDSGEAGSELRSPVLAAVSDALSDLLQEDRSALAAVDATLEGQLSLPRDAAGRCLLLNNELTGAFAEPTGSALEGYHPYLVMAGPLLQQSLDYLANNTFRRRPATLIVVGAPPAAHASEGLAASRLALLRLLPEIPIAVPSDAAEVRQAIAWARGLGGPAAIHMPTSLAARHGKVGPAAPFETGRSEVLSDGFDVALLASGSRVALALRAAELLSEQGVSVAVVNMRFTRPLDGEVLGRLSRQVGGFITLEDEHGVGGFGSAVLEWMADAGVSLPVIRGSRPGLRNVSTEDASEEVTVDHVVRQAVDLVERATGVAGLYGGSGARRSRKSDLRRTAAADEFGFSADSLHREQEVIAGRTLSSEVEAWYSIYSQVGERRRFLWQWCEQGAELTTLPCVSPDLFHDVCQTKVLSIMLCVLLDDVADQRGRERFLEYLVKIVDDPHDVDLKGLDQTERHYAEVALELAAIYHERVRGYPRHDAYADLLRYDQLQYFNTMRYSQLLNRNLWLLNPVEHDLYLPHAMDMMSFASIDLMCSPTFNLAELGRLREALWYLQCMGRIGNLLSTWRREIRQQDFTSGVFARAVARGDLTVEQLCQPDSQQIEAAILNGDHEQYFYRRWQYYRKCFVAVSESIASIEMSRLLDGNERFFRMHVAGCGMI